jgi:uncharacterized protein (DUF427 family)
MDAWLEEDEEIFGHPTDPYHRVDVRFSSRPVRVVLGGQTVAETTQAQFLFETNMPTRYYFPKQDVRIDLLETSESQSVCPYKGNAVYWSARIGDEKHEDVVWSYPNPKPNCPHIEGLMCFFNERVDDIFVDGEPVPKVETKWSRK